MRTTKKNFSRKAGERAKAMFKVAIFIFLLFCTTGVMANCSPGKVDIHLDMPFDSSIWVMVGASLMMSVYVFVRRQ